MSLQECGDFYMTTWRMVKRYFSEPYKGTHCATPAPVLQVLIEMFGLDTEACSSALSAQLRYWYSQYPDVDQKLGSFPKDFLRSNPLQHHGRRVILVNPPFAAEFIVVLMTHISLLLQEAHAAHESLTFICLLSASLVPTLPVLSDLMRSEYCTYRFEVAKGKHGYTNPFCALGDSKENGRMGDAYRMASFNTMMIFLQTPEAAHRLPMNKSIEDRITKQWAMCF
jgi:hypothetical protein